MSSSSVMTSTVLYVIQILLDDNGARDWNLRHVAIVSAVILGMIKLCFHHSYGVDWYSQVNAIVTGFGAILCLYLNTFAAEEMTGMTELYRTAHCEPPLTSLHRVLPAVAMGYAVLDIMDGFALGIDFFLHGMGTFAVMVFFCESDRPQIVAPFLIMECSTIFLNLRGATFCSNTALAVIQILFVFFFTLCRIIIVPIYHYQLVKALFSSAHTQHACDAPYFKWVVLFFGLFFHCLNGFWFYKLQRKIRRKLSGQEKIRDKLSLEHSMKSE